MPIKNTGVEYEKLVSHIFSVILRDTPSATVVRDEKIVGPEGPRQVDIAIYHSIAGVKYLTAIECRDFNKRIDITNVEGFNSKLHDIKASKGIMVTRIGYSRNAAQKAMRLGIELFIADTAEKIASKPYKAIPVTICRAAVLAFSPCFRLGPSTPTEFIFDPKRPINGTPRNHILTESFRRGLVAEVETDIEINRFRSHLNFQMKELNAFVDLNTYFSGAPVWVEDASGQKHIVNDPKLLLRVKYSFFFGHIEDMKTALQIVDPQSNEAQIVFDASELNDLPARLTEVRSIEDVPEYARSYGLRVLLVDDLIPDEEIQVSVYRET